MLFGLPSVICCRCCIFILILIIHSVLTWLRNLMQSERATLMRMSTWVVIDHPFLSVALSRYIHVYTFQRNQQNEHQIATNNNNNHNNKAQINSQSAIICFRINAAFFVVVLLAPNIELEWLRDWNFFSPLYGVPITSSHDPMNKTSLSVAVNWVRRRTYIYTFFQFRISEIAFNSKLSYFKSMEFLLIFVFFFFHYAW